MIVSGFHALTNILILGGNNKKKMVSSILSQNSQNFNRLNTDFSMQVRQVVKLKPLLFYREMV